MSRHSTAIIDSSARLGANVEIGPYAVIGPNTILGDGCKIHSHAVVEHSEMGAGCEVFPFASVGLPAQHLGYKGEPSKVLVGEKTIFREGVTVNRGTAFDANMTTIGNECFFMAQSHVAHDCRVGNNVIMANGAMLAGHVHVGDRTFISGLVAVHQHVRIGKGVMVSGGAMVPQDVSPYSLVQGDRAIWRGLNLVGLKRAGINKDSLRKLKNAYKIVFNSGLRVEDALKNELFDDKDPFVQEVKLFFSTANRGFTRPDPQQLADGSEAT